MGHIYLKVGKPVDMGILDSNMEKLLEEDYFALYDSYAFIKRLFRISECKGR